MLRVATIAIGLWLVLAACRHAQTRADAGSANPPPSQSGPAAPSLTADQIRRAVGSVPRLGIVSTPIVAAPPGSCARLGACCDALRSLAEAAPLVQTYCGVATTPGPDGGENVDCVVNLRLLGARIPTLGAMPAACAAP